VVAVVIAGLFAVATERGRTIEGEDRESEFALGEECVDVGW
jgi:hypothetical protein